MHLKRFASEMINAGQGVDSRYLAQFRANHRSFGKVRSGPGNLDADTAILPHIVHMDEMPKNVKHRAPDDVINDDGELVRKGELISSVPPERQETLRKRADHVRKIFIQDRLSISWQGELRRQGFEDFHRVLLKQNPERIWMYFQGLNYFFLEETEKTVRRSIVYRDRTRAMRKFKLDRITWVETLTEADLKRMKTAQEEKQDDPKMLLR